MNEFEIELEVGEALSIGGYSLTLLDIDGQTVCVRVDDDAEADARDGVTPAAMLR